jgi:hypothetical protein
MPRALPHTATHCCTEPRAPPHTATLLVHCHICAPCRTAAHCHTAAHYRTAAHCSTAAHCRTVAQPETASRTTFIHYQAHRPTLPCALPHTATRTTTHRRVHCLTQPRALPQTAALPHIHCCTAPHALPHCHTLPSALPRPATRTARTARTDYCAHYDANARTLSWPPPGGVRPLAAPSSCPNIFLGGRPLPSSARPSQPYSVLGG